MVQEHTASAATLGAYGAGNTFQVQIRVADQIGRLTCAAFVCMLVCIKIQREILKCEIALKRIDPVLFQRQRMDAAAGNGQGLLMGLIKPPELKPRIHLNVRQQVDLGAIRCVIDRLLQRCVGRAADLAHSQGCGAAGAASAARRVIVKSCGAVGVVRRGIVIRKGVLQARLRKAGSSSRAGFCIHDSEPLAVRIRKAFLRARLRKAGSSSRAGFFIHDSEPLFLQIIKGVGNGGKVTPAQNVAVRIRDGGVGAQCKHTRRQNTKQQSDGKYHYEPSLFHDFFPPLSKM